MPNHCTNTLLIKGDLKHRQEFVDKNKGFAWGDTAKKGKYKTLSFNAQVPMPKKHIASNAKSKVNDDWYPWAKKHWGTKWDCYEEELVHEKNYTCYSFETAWCPPIEWVKKVSRTFPHLEFNGEWAESGGTGGKIMFQGGECFYDEAMTEEEWNQHQGIVEDEDW